MILFKFRKATKKDIKKIALLMQKEFNKPPFNEKASIKAVMKSLNFFLKTGQIFTAVKQKQIIGVVVFKIEQWWQGQVIIIEDLAVKQELQKQKVGKMLLNKVEEFAGTNKIKLICFKTNKKSNSIKFYKKEGYKIRQNIIEMEKKIKI
ncbi:MAG: GNAT family N-acetyltransferase [archaeon]|nr:GNAT family N-acetyltransferase [archaeon]